MLEWLHFNEWRNPESIWQRASRPCWQSYAVQSIPVSRRCKSWSWNWAQIVVCYRGSVGHSIPFLHPVSSQKYGLDSTGNTLSSHTLHFLEGRLLWSFVYFIFFRTSSFFNYRVGNVGIFSIETDYAHLFDQLAQSFLVVIAAAALSRSFNEARLLLLIVLKACSVCQWIKSVSSDSCWFSFCRWEFFWPALMYCILVYQA